MNSTGHRSGFRPRLLAGLFVVLAMPALASAEALQFQNEAGAPVVVQAACVVRGRLLRDRPYLVQVNDKSPAIVLPGDKVITIYEAKVPNRVLFQGVIPAGLEDQAFSIKLDAKPPGLKLEKIVPPKPKRP